MAICSRIRVDPLSRCREPRVMSRTTSWGTIRSFTNTPIGIIFRSKPLAAVRRPRCRSTWTGSKNPPAPVTLSGSEEMNTRRFQASRVLLLASVVAAVGAAAFAQQNSPDLEILKVQGNVYMIPNAGGNVVVQVSDEGVLVVDTGLKA